MAVTLFTVACGYVGARAVPELLLNNEWRENLETLEVHPAALNHPSFSCFMQISDIRARHAMRCCAQCSTTTPSLVPEEEWCCCIQR